MAACWDTGGSCSVVPWAGRDRRRNISVSIPDIPAFKGFFTHIFCCLPWGEQGTVDTFFDHPEEPHGGMLYLGLLRKGFFPPPSPSGSAKAAQPTLVQCSFTSAARGFGKGRGLSLAMYSTQLNKPCIKHCRCWCLTAA